jgi:hypothetical protein
MSQSRQTKEKEMPYTFSTLVALTQFLADVYPPTVQYDHNSSGSYHAGWKYGHQTNVNLMGAMDVAEYTVVPAEFMRGFGRARLGLA